MPPSTIVNRADHIRRELPDDHAFDVVICYDATGSMKGFINAVKGSANDMVKDILEQIPNVHIGVS